MVDHTENIESIIERFYFWEKNTPDAIFLRQPMGANWKDISYAQAGKEARSMTSALRDKGLVIGDHVGILSKNCYHWILADLAILMGGFVSVPYYSSLPKGQLREVVELSDVKLIFVGKLDIWGDKGDAIPESTQVVRFPHYAGNAEIGMGDDWNELVAKYEPVVDNWVPDLDSVWTIKFTSGTTGTPKGVMHSHRTPAQVMADEKRTNWIGIYQLPELRCLSYLPLNHVGERMGIEVPVIYLGGTIAFSESLDMFANNIQDIQPTFFFGVPRIWTKFYLGIIEKIPLKKLNLLLKIPIVSGLIKKKVRHAIGMRDVRVAATGAAITPAFLKDFYKKMDIHLIEAYGMTEVCGSICNNPDPSSPPDSVGQVVPGAQIKIHPDTQEVLMNTPYVMLGYYKNSEKTDQVLQNGWVHSGDRGSIDEHGFVRITGRVGDAFKTAKGSYVTPNPMEEGIGKNEHVAQVCVVGLGLPQPIALINLSEQAEIAPRNYVSDSILRSINVVNSSRAGFEHISTAVILSEPWSEEINILTPTLKIKRGQVDARYQDRYLDWHQSKEQVIWV